VWFPSGKIDQDVINELNTASDRSVGVIAGAMVDSRLSDLLRLEMHGGYQDEAYDSKIRKQMFDADGPIGSYGARCGIAYLLGFFTTDAHADLQTFGSIRNSFAHYTEHNSFDSESIKARCGNFRLLEKRIEKATGWMEDDTGKRIPIDTIQQSREHFAIQLADYENALKTPKGRFIATAKLFAAAVTLYLMPGHDGKKPPVFQGRLAKPIL
jgi:DNA-binding MltR family transcriptional regulator